MKPNITMVGMPSSGKSTIGMLLTRRPGSSFVDASIMIQEKEGQLLKEIIAEEGMDGFLKMEKRISAGLDVQLSAIAPGGSIVYSEETIKHLKGIGEVAHLEMSYEEMKSRIGNVADRGIALKSGFTPRDPYNERVPYYEKCADVTIDGEGRTPGEIVDELRLMIEPMVDRDMVQRTVEEQKRELEEKNRKLQEYEIEVASLKEQLVQMQT